jgi:hypothetical protein
MPNSSCETMPTNKPKCKEANTLKKCRFFNAYNNQMLNKTIKLVIA